MLNINVGKKIEYYRKKKNLTLNDLSEKSGLSIGYLSNLENGKSSLTLDKIQIICEILDISLMKLLEEGSFSGTVIKNDKREIIYEENKQIKYEYIKFGHYLLNGLLITIQPDTYFERTWEHSYDEIGFVIEGEVILVLEDEEYYLEKGDSFYVRKNTQHSLKNQSDEISISYWVRGSQD